MDCPHCNSNNTGLCKNKTALGYCQYRCSKCSKQFNDSTGTPFNFIEFSNEIVMIVVHHYYRFELSLDDVVEMMALRNIFLCHQTVANWVQTFGIELSLKFRKRRKGSAGKK